MAPVASDSRSHRVVPQRFVLDDISWDQYVTISDALISQRGLRLTYDGRRLEFRTLSFWHYRIRHLLGRIIDALSLEMRIDVQGGGSATIRRADAQCGLEPDECYWIEHAAEMIGTQESDPANHPPPDLGAEVDLGESSLSRVDVYSRLRVPELWRFDGQTLATLRLAESGTYVPVSRSLAFGFLQISDLEPFLSPGENSSDTRVIRRFVDWLRKQHVQQN